MEKVAFLGIVFGIIIAFLAMRRPLYQAILGGLLGMVILFRIPVKQFFLCVSYVFTNWNSFAILLSLYLITYLQRMLEARRQIKLAQEDLNGIFHNRRINAGVAPVFIGLLPAAAAMILCGDIVKESTEGYLKPRDQAYVTNWFRHIPESTLPTYTGVLLMSNLSGVPLAPFTLAMIVPMIVLAAIGYFPCLHRLPKDPGTPYSENRLRDVVRLFSHLWSLLAIMVLILVGKLTVVPSVLIVIVISAFVYRFKPSELLPMFKSAVEKKMLSNTFLVLVLKEVITYTGVLALIPELLSDLPIPTYLIFVLLFFCGGVISSSSGIIAMGTPLAFAAMPDGGVALMVLLMCVVHGANLVAPTHVCMVVASDYFGVTLGSLIRRTIPSSLIFVALMIGYYNLLLLIL